MKKLLIFTFVILILFGCSNEADNADNADKLTAAEETIASLEDRISKMSAELLAAETRATEAEFELFSTINAGFTDPAVFNQNTIVQNPQKNRVTFEIDERLVGRYVCGDAPDEYDPKYVEEYFEIRPDATVEIAIATFEGAATYYSDNIQLTAFYFDSEYVDRVYINFNLVSGKSTFPASCGLSITFCCNSKSLESFEATTYLPRYHITFVKQKT
ncbi:MAG: hypothetical protein FWG53_06770 [Clostridiales bacterium]|nr:hypothetical protein [Clostridiales bacterium]